MRKVNRAGEKPGNPADFAVREASRLWGRSISRVDAHATKCKACNRPRHSHLLAVQTGALLDLAMEAYQPCRRAKLLYIDERAALAAYLAAGGKLPVREPLKRLVGLMLLLVPWAVLALGVAR